MNLGIDFLIEGIPELLRVNLLLTSLTIQRFRMSEEMSKKLQILLAPDRELKTFFPEVPVVEFRNSKSLKDYLVTAALPKMGNAGNPEPCGKGTCQVSDYIITTNTFTTKHVGKYLKFKVGFLTVTQKRFFTF